MQTTRQGPPGGPRIYNLFPTLAGPVTTWSKHLPRIADMHFDWIFLNPVHLPGASGSLYAIKDDRRLHPLLRPDNDTPGDDLLSDFTAAARDAGLRVMLDLVINHSAKDGVLADNHPEWFARDDNGEIRSPSVADLDDPDKVTVWEDLAELDYSERPERDDMLSYWQDLIRRYLRLGFDGFRCDAAYKLPGEVWRRLIEAARDSNPDARFFAETLGAPPEEIEQLRPAGFDYLFNSAKWWDFRGDWLLDQYARFRDLAPSIAFPESHDTERLAEETDGDAGESRFRYLFAAVFSSGVMMPMGYELGFRRPLHVVDTRPEDWDSEAEDPAFDIRDFLARVNTMKRDTPVLNEEGPQRRFTDPGSPLVGLLRHSRHGSQRSAALINPAEAETQSISREALTAALRCAADEVREITPQAANPDPGGAGENAGAGPDPGRGEDGMITVPPRGLRLFVAD